MTRMQLGYCWIVRVHVAGGRAPRWVTVHRRALRVVHKHATDPDIATGIEYQETMGSGSTLYAAAAMVCKSRADADRIADYLNRNNARDDDATAQTLLALRYE